MLDCCSGYLSHSCLFKGFSRSEFCVNSAATSAVEKLEELKTDTSLQQEEKNFIDNCLASVRGLLTGSLKAVNMVTRLENGELSDPAPSLLAVIPSTNPYKRAEGEPFVSVIGLDSNSQSLRVLVGYAQTFISAVEKIGLALPYGFKLQYMDASHIDDAQAVVYDVASGTVLLHPRWADHISSLPLEFVEETYGSMSQMVASASGSPVGTVHSCDVIHLFSVSVFFRPSPAIYYLHFKHSY